MTATNLKQHYDEKYRHEKEQETLPLISGWEHPDDRFKAAMFHLHRYVDGGSILELGAGNGLLARNLIATGLKFDTYTVSDWSDSRFLGVLRALSDPRCRAEKIDAENIDAEQFGRYDVVVMVALIEHLVDPLGAMRQIRKLLKPGGFVYIDTPNIAKWTRRIRLLIGQFPSTASKDEGLRRYEGSDVTLYDEGHLHYFSYRSLGQMLTRYCGYSRIVRGGYYPARFPLGKRIGFALARAWPEMFSELVVIAYA